MRLAVQVKPFYRRMFEAEARRVARTGPPAAHQLSPQHAGENPAGAEDLNTEALAGIRDGGHLPDVPVIVLAAIGIDPVPAVLIPAAQLGERNSQNAAIYGPLAGSVRVASTGRSRAQGTRRSTGRPDAVVQAIRDLLDTAGRVTAPPRTSERPSQTDVTAARTGTDWHAQNTPNLCGRRFA
jgi:hypothetical protein